MKWESGEKAIHLAEGFEQRQGLINHCLDRPNITAQKAQNVEKHFSPLQGRAGCAGELSVCPYQLVL